MRIYQTSKIRGFTLVELAIVITIIGILIGGVLKGQQLIDQARVAATISQMSDYRTAYRIFMTTYNEKPGDMLDPDSRLVGCSGCASDDTYPKGNGIVGMGGDGPSWPQSTKDLEPVRFWLHMLKAGLISGVSDAALDASTPAAFGETQPRAKVGGGWGAKTGGRDCQGTRATTWAPGCIPEGLVLVIQPELNERIDHSHNLLSPMQAAQFDRKVDDGKSGSGDLRAAGAECQNGGPNSDTYNESATDKPRCTIGYIIDD